MSTVRTLAVIYAVIAGGYLIQDCNRGKCNAASFVSAATSPFMVGAIAREWAVGNL